MADSPLKKKVRKKTLQKDAPKRPLPRPDADQKGDLPQPGDQSRVAAKSPLYQVPIARMKEAEYVRSSYIMHLPADVTEEQIRDERFYAHVSTAFKPGDVLYLIADDASWEVEARVRAAGRLYAQVQIVNRIDFNEDVTLPQTSPYTIQYGGGHAKYRVMRDNEPIRDGFASKRDAQRWIDSHMQAESM